MWNQWIDTFWDQWTKMSWYIAFIKKYNLCVLRKLCSCPPLHNADAHDRSYQWENHSLYRLIIISLSWAPCLVLTKEATNWKWHATSYVVNVVRKWRHGRVLGARSLEKCAVRICTWTRLLAMKILKILHSKIIHKKKKKKLLFQACLQSAHSDQTQIFRN